MEARARSCVCHMVCARERPRERECKLTFTCLWLPDSPAPTSHPLPRDFLWPLSGCLPAHHGTAGTGAPSECPLLDSARVTRHRPRAMRNDRRWQGRMLRSCASVHALAEAMLGLYGRSWQHP